MKKNNKLNSNISKGREVSDKDNRLKYTRNGCKKKTPTSNDKTSINSRSYSNNTGGVHNTDISYDNNPMNYAYDSSLGQAAYSIHFADTLGSPIRYIDCLGNKKDVRIPGVCTFNVFPTPCIANDSFAPVNISAYEIFGKVRANNIASATYDASTLMLYLLAYGEIGSLIVWLRHIYGLTNVYASTNAYYPRVLLISMGVDPDDLVTNLADFRASINNMISNINEWTAPSSFVYYRRKWWLYSKFFKDCDVDNEYAQVYGFVPSTFLVWQPTEYSGSSVTNFGKLVPSSIRRADVLYHEVGRRMGYVQLLSLMRELVSGFTSDPDFRIINGDIKRTFPPTESVIFDYIPIDYSAYPVYSPSAMIQINNAEIMTADSTTCTNLQTNFKITERVEGSSSIVVGNFHAPSIYLPSAHPVHWVNSYNLAPTWEEVAEAVAFKYVMSTHDNTGFIAQGELTAVRTEVILNQYIWQFSPSDAGYDPLVTMLSGFYVTTTGGNSGISGPYLATNMRHELVFAHRPKKSIILGTNVETMTVNACNPSADVTNLTTIDDATLSSMHNIAMRALFSLRNISSNVVSLDGLD